MYKRNFILTLEKVMLSGGQMWVGPNLFPMNWTFEK